MATEKKAVVHSPTVTEVIDKFVAAIRDDETVPVHNAERLAELLAVGTVPKHEDLQRALFEVSPDGNHDPDQKHSN